MMTDHYPYWWYLRNFPNQRYFGSTPTRDLRDVPIILVGQDNFGKIEPVVGQAYNKFDYTRIWWPNMDYMNLNKDRIKNVILNPQMREALFQIWLNRDYTLIVSLLTDMSIKINPPKNFDFISQNVLSYDYDDSLHTSCTSRSYEGKNILTR
jgi:hypothetical protein